MFYSISDYAIFKRTSCVFRFVGGVENMSLLKGAGNLEKAENHWCGLPNQNYSCFDKVRRG